MERVKVGPVFLGFIALGLSSKLLQFGPLTVAWYTKQPMDGLLYWSLSLAVTFLAAIIGGFVATRLSGRRGFRTALATAALTITVQLGFYLFSDGIHWTPWMVAVDSALLVPGALLGAHVELTAGRTSAST